MKAAKLNWILGVALATFVLGIGAAFYTGRLAVVSAQDFSVFTPNNYGADGMRVVCSQTSYRTFNTETVVVTGHSSGQPSVMSGGALIQHANLVFEGKKLVMPPLVQWWGNTSYHGRTSYLESHEPNWVTFGCLNRPTH